MRGELISNVLGDRWSNLNNSGLFITLVIILYVLVAHFSTGYYHWDEHYQIIEFANYKLGKTEAANLAWEFNAGIRPTLQPWLCYYIFRICGFLGIENPFHLAFVLRLLTGLLAVFSIHRFVAASQSHIKMEWRAYFVVFSYLLWVLPSINVRFSSETWSGLFFLLALSIVHQGRYKHRSVDLCKIGFLLGISFLFRYQSAILGMGLIMWLIFIDRLYYKKLALLIAAGFSLVLASFLLDYYFYGEATFSIFNYFYINIVEGVSSHFGTSPWYQYFIEIILSFNVFGVLTLIAFFIMLFRDYRNAVVWCILPFVFIHSIIPHKELRFLFPIVNLVPYILIAGWQPYLSFSLRRKLLLYFVLGILLLVNTFGLFATPFQPSGKGTISVPTYIDAHYRERPINLIVVEGSNPYQEWGNPTNSFYLHSDMSLSTVSSIWSATLQDSIETGRLNLLVVPEVEMTGSMTYNYLREQGFRKVYQSVHPAIRKINDLYDRSINSKTFYLFEYKPDTANTNRSIDR